MFVVFDLDGTLALNEHRQHFVARPKGERDWPAFFQACDLDTLNVPIAEVLRALVANGHRVEIWSGRSAEVIDKTRVWLIQNGLYPPYIPFRCRDAGDQTPDHELKKSWLDAADPKPDLVFDDRASVVKMWREAGVVCAQVAPGEF